MSSLSSLGSATAVFFTQQTTAATRTRPSPAPAAPPPAQATSPTQSLSEDEELAQHLEEFDPRLGKNFQALMAFIEQTNPEAAQVLRRSVRAVLNHAPARGQPASQGQVGANNTQASQVRTQRIQVAFQATVTELRAKAANGEQITARQVEVTFAAQFEQTMGQSDPLVLDLNGNGRFEVTTAAAGHHFDLTAAGRRVQAATVTGGDGLLALDRNGNGQIDDGRELFGDQRGALHGFVELAKLDGNRDGFIDANDADFAKLGIYRDDNRNGLTDTGDLRTLADYHIARIAVASHEVREEANSNLVIRAGAFQRDDGSQGRVGDLLLNYLA